MYTYIHIVNKYMYIKIIPLNMYMYRYLKKLTFVVWNQAPSMVLFRRNCVLKGYSFLKTIYMYIVFTLGCYVHFHYFIGQSLHDWLFLNHCTNVKMSTCSKGTASLVQYSLIWIQYTIHVVSAVQIVIFLISIMTYTQ